MNLDEIITKTVNTTVLKLKMAGLLRDDRKTAYQKTEELLKNYPDFLLSDQPYTKKLVKRIDDALKDISNDPYYEVIPRFYFDKEPRESIAFDFDTTVTTISRNKTKLINEIKAKLFSDEVIQELFLD